MKRNSFIKYSFLSVGLLLASCDDAIDLSPTHSLAKNNAFQKIEDFDTALSGVYAGMRSVAYYGRNYSVLPDMMTDNLSETSESLANFRSMSDWQFTSDNGTVAETWQGVYNIINNTNIILGDIDRFTTTQNKKQANRIKGQALAIRGLLHFDLLRYYANNFDRNATDLGVAIKLASNLDSPPRSTVKECYDQIFKDLTDALALLGDIDAAVNTATKRNQIDALGVNAILARASLYAKQYDDAIRYSTAVITALPLASRTAFPEVWRDNSTAEVAWAVFFGPNEGGRLAGDVFSPVGNTRAQFDPAADVVNFYDKTNDIRYRSYFTFELPLSGRPRTGRTVATKYFGKGTALDGIVNFKAFRTGEMYLIRAEARALTSRAADALADLNTLRAARIASYTPGTETGQALTDAIATERRKELFMEGHRWFDLKRTTRSVVRNNCRPPATACTLASSSFRWTLPIPQGEILANNKITQNGGY